MSYSIELSEIIRDVIVFSFVFYANEFLMRGLKRFRKPITVISKWNDINEVPIPKKENLLNRDIMISEGTKVCLEEFDCLRYDINGNIKIGNESTATHWQYAPTPPK